jgi:hypothetical protein
MLVLPSSEANLNILDSPGQTLGHVEGALLATPHITCATLTLPVLT